MRRIETFDWWNDLLSQKDELSLRELAERFNVTPGAISAAFKRSGTSRQPAPPGPRALRHKAEEDPIEALPPEAGELPRPGSPRPGSKDAQLDQHVRLLGHVPDAEVARIAGVSVRTVASFRARRQIAGYQGPRRLSEREEEAAGRASALGRNGENGRSIGRNGAGGSAAYRVVLRNGGRDQEGVVVAPSLLDAARTAASLNRGAVVAVSLVGDVF
jgi:hypothetical protein